MYHEPDKNWLAGRQLPTPAIEHSNKLRMTVKLQTT